MAQTNHEIWHACGHEQIHKYGGKPEYQERRRAELSATLCSTCRTKYEIAPSGAWREKYAIVPASSFDGYAYPSCGAIYCPDTGWWWGDLHDPDDRMSHADFISAGNEIFDKSSAAETIEVYLRSTRKHSHETLTSGDEPAHVRLLREAKDQTAADYLAERWHKLVQSWQRNQELLEAHEYAEQQVRAESDGYARDQWEGR